MKPKQLETLDRETFIEALTLHTKKKGQFAVTLKKSDFNALLASDSGLTVDVVRERPKSVEIILST
jgi:hypothetical protein